MIKRTPRRRSRLEAERRAAQLTQSALARLAQVTQSTISKLERQKLTRPGVDVLARLAWALTRCGRTVDAIDLHPKRLSRSPIPPRPRRDVA